MPSKTAIASLTAAGAGGSALGGFYIYRNSGLDTKETLSSLLSKDKDRVILVSSDDRHSKAFDALVTEYSTVSDFRIPSSFLGSGTLTKDKLIGFCNSYGQSKDASGFEMYKRWCSRNSLRSQMNSLQGKKWIDSGDKKDWAAPKGLYEDTLQIPVAQGSGNIQKSSLKEEDLMAYCSKSSSLVFTSAEDDYYKRVEKYCVTSTTQGAG
ncbi:hypothetical protein HF1_05310 [Mycoplasma haemofelis str. Langford 1]|uniref:Uncharacterized protein n=1 Tax=Mycoplasma haemofelis (strain Langford 1) TaxID=941640 RepID=E8ZHB8_MYCHL|nr:hypothetical protein [Mycoplasma haemofelis]CBY92539.1 hypothetical protein HF1_05310 [Mycoplasma haemofelis str. Langford 1]